MLIEFCKLNKIIYSVVENKIPNIHDLVSFNNNTYQVMSRKLCYKSNSLEKIQINIV